MHRSSIFSLESRLDGLPLRASNEALQLPYPPSRGVAEAALYCAHRTSTASSCAFCEQEGHLAAPPRPSNGEYSPAPGLSRLCSTMEQTRAYHRSLYRLPVTYPAMYCVMSTVGEGTITNLSAVGCMIETDQPLRADQDVALRLLLPDQHESLPIELAHVRWTNGKQAGIEFVQVEPTANLRLHGFVWDQMVQRVHTIQQHRAMS